MRSLRAIYNHARKTCRKLPAENPTFAVDWNPQDRRDTALGQSELPGWFEQLSAIPNPIRREFHLLTVLSGDPGAEATHSFATYVRDAISVLDHVDCHEAVVCGMAYGARVAVQMARDCRREIAISFTEVRA
jgi:hypothetical protein